MAEKGVVLVLAWDKMVLLTIRDLNPNIASRFRTTLPSGGVKEGENVEEAAKRILATEFGLDVPLINLGTTEKDNTFFYAELGSSNIPKLGPGQGCGFTFINIDGLMQWLNTGPPDLVGIVTSRVKLKFLTFASLVEEGSRLPDTFFR
jgi:hypothetical protein